MNDYDNRHQLRQMILDANIISNNEVTNDIFASTVIYDGIVISLNNNDAGDSRVSLKFSVKDTEKNVFSLLWDFTCTKEIDPFDQYIDADITDRLMITDMQKFHNISLTIQNTSPETMRDYPYYNYIFTDTNNSISVYKIYFSINDILQIKRIISLLFFGYCPNQKNAMQILSMDKLKFVDIKYDRGILEIKKILYCRAADHCIVLLKVPHKNGSCKYFSVSVGDIKLSRSARRSELVTTKDNEFMETVKNPENVEDPGRIDLFVLEGDINMIDLEYKTSLYSKLINHKTLFFVNNDTGVNDYIILSFMTGAYDMFTSDLFEKLNSL